MSGAHRHERAPMPPVDAGHYGGPAGAVVDMDDVLDLVAAALAGCKPCQRQGMYAVTRARDHLAATHLVATAYRLVSQVLAPITGKPMDDAHLATRYAEPTQRVFRALRDQGPAAAGAVMAGLDRDGRRAAVDDALDLIAGLPGALELLATLDPAGPAAAAAEPAGEGRVKVVTVDQLVDELPPGPSDLMLAWWGPYPALVADEPPLAALVGDRALNLHLQTWLAQGFTTAHPDQAPPVVPGWTVRVRADALAAIGTPGGGAWWEADQAGLAVEIPFVWLGAARKLGKVAILAGDIGADRTDDHAAAMDQAVRAGRVAVGLAVLDDA